VRLHNGKYGIVTLRSSEENKRKTKSKKIKNTIITRDHHMKNQREEDIPHLLKDV
jgi:hypothetical protein